jgi:hypothetical protein
MAKWTIDLVMDAALDYIATGTIMTVCSAQPTNRTEAVTTYALADVSLAGGDFTKANGDSSGRKTTVAQKSNVTIDTTGTATHIAISDATNVILVTTCTSQALTAGGTVTVPSFKDEIGDPV